MSNADKVKIVEDEITEDENINEPEALDEIEDTVDQEESDDIEDGATLDDFDDNEELWDGGPTVGQAKAWKEAYGRVVVGTLGNGEHYVIRPLNRAEYRNHILALERSRAAVGAGEMPTETLDTEETITKIALLYPEMDDRQLRTFGSAGFPTLVSQQVLEISDFVAGGTTELF